MKKFSKLICLSILPLITFLFFTCIGEYRLKSIFFSNEMHSGIQYEIHHGISSDMYLFLWILRGIYSALLVAAILFAFNYDINKLRKSIVILLLLSFNVPVIYFVNSFIYFPAIVLAIIVVNIIAFIPFYIKNK